MNYMDIKYLDSSNGLGYRTSLFVSGCRIHCKGCFNKCSWDFDAGFKFTSHEENLILNSLNRDEVKGFSLLGGEPLDEAHTSTLKPLLAKIKERYPRKDIWLWTGYNFSKIKNHELLDYVDVLITEPFVLSLKGEFNFKGSANQRIFIHYKSCFEEVEDNKQGMDALNRFCSVIYGD